MGKSSYISSVEQATGNNGEEPDKWQYLPTWKTLQLMFAVMEMPFILSTMIVMMSKTNIPYVYCGVTSINGELSQITTTCFIL
eukprot:12339361-Heterocapsa_arctica.AAC.1